MTDFEENFEVRKKWYFDQNSKPLFLGKNGLKISQFHAQINDRNGKLWLDYEKIFKSVKKDKNQKRALWLQSEFPHFGH